MTAQVGYSRLVMVRDALRAPHHEADIGERRPLGDDVFAHPLILFFMAAISGLLVVRATLSRPVPEVIPERPLLLGCFAGLAAFLAGNWIVAHVLGG